MACSYTREVWKDVDLEFKVKASWNKQSIEGCLHECIMDRVVKNLKALPCQFVYWTWWSHNMKIFQDKHVPPAVIAHLIIRQMKEYESCLKDKKHTDLVMPEINFEILWGHFNGAS